MAGKRKSRGAADAIIEEIERQKPAKDEVPAWRTAREDHLTELLARVLAEIIPATGKEDWRYNFVNELVVRVDIPKATLERARAALGRTTHGR